MMRQVSRFSKCCSKFLRKALRAQPLPPGENKITIKQEGQFSTTTRPCFEKWSGKEWAETVKKLCRDWERKIAQAGVRTCSGVLLEVESDFFFEKKAKWEEKLLNGLSKDATGEKKKKKEKKRNTQQD